MPHAGIDVNAEAAVAKEGDEAVWSDVIAGLGEKRDELRTISGRENLSAIRMVVRFVRINSCDVGGVAIFGCDAGIVEPARNVAAADGPVDRMLNFAAAFHHETVLNHAAFVAGVGHDGPPTGLRPGHDAHPIIGKIRGGMTVAAQVCRCRNDQRRAVCVDLAACQRRQCIQIDRSKI